MNTDKLKAEIVNLIAAKREGDYWDFKQKHHTNNSDLLHDIICMANNRADREGYIIFGVTDADFEIVGVKDDENRKNQQQMIDFLKDKKFAGGIRPTIELKTLYIGSHEVDVLIIKNTTDTPYYMLETFKGIMSNYIYTRIGDTNTPKDRSADINHIEYLWKKRFLLNRPPLQQIEKKLIYKEEWKEEDRTYYNIYNPAFKICIVDGDEEYERSKPEFYAYSMYNSSVIYRDLQIKYYETKLYSRQLVVLDSGRFITPTPEWGYLQFGEYRSSTDYAFKYYIKDSLDYKILEFLLKEDSEEAYYAYRHLREVVLEFDNSLEKDNFISYVEVNQIILEDLIEENKDKYSYLDIKEDREKVIVIKRLKIGIALNKMLNDFRNLNYK
ncbi:ATP-binding protein [Paraclostridium sordellii]|uniref:ATP-binding protein n=1 Tax=Paraclostridium sordellii TaxID=1505 RepID=UPI0005E53EB5|nr:ATP-binding protein [Paeniclostridium sordellii]CEP80540.1 putative transcriptional regulator with HTH domain [[Clostridium] sordellii] [Paeniclostridium sordellii]